MRLLYVVFMVTTILVACNFAVAAADSQPVDASKTFPERGLWRETHATRTNGINNKRFLQVEGTSNQSIIVTRSMNETSNNKSTAAPSKEEKLKFSVMSAKTTPNFAEERGVKVAGLSKFFKGKKVTTAVTNLLRRNKKQKILRKFRIKLLESLPPEQAANLIFLKMPKKELPLELPSKLPKGIKGFDFKIPGVSDAIIRLKMEIWYYYRAPPSFVFRKLGLFGKGSGEILHAEENYKYFKSYWEAWTDAQKHLNF